jgi:hypothetical protein
MIANEVGWVIGFSVGRENKGIDELKFSEINFQGVHSVRLLKYVCCTGEVVSEIVISHSFPLKNRTSVL